MFWLIVQESFHRGREEMAAEGRAIRKVWGRRQLVGHMASAMERPREMNAGVQLTLFF